MARALISVVTPCEGRAELVEDLLRSLAESRAQFTEPIEVLIVDSSEGALGSRIASSCERYGAKYLAGPRSVRQKRNAGVRVATGKYILFVDSDVTVRADLLTRHLEAIAAIGEDVVGGSVGVTQFEGRRSIINRIAEASPFARAFSFARHEGYCSWATTSNVMLAREAFDRVGGFDDTLPFKLGGDDLDLTWRITQSGLRLKSAPEAIVYHTRETWSRLRPFASRVWRWGRVEHHLRKKHSAFVRPQFPPLWFWCGLSALGWRLSYLYSSAGLRRGIGAMSLWLFGSLVLEQVRRRRLSLRKWIGAPCVIAFEALYRLGSWREALSRRTFTRPFVKMYFSDRDVSGAVEAQSWIAWAMLTAAIAAWAVL